jgi:hypothetical protein
VCSFHVAAGAKQSLDEAPYKLSGAVAKLASIIFSSLDGDLHQHRAATSNHFLAPLLGKKKTSARGVSHAHPLLCFSFAFTLFIFACIVLSKIQKN